MSDLGCACDKLRGFYNRKQLGRVKGNDLLTNIFEGETHDQMEVMNNENFHLK